jgi:hypothetical protein
MVLNKRRDVENGIRALLREVGPKVGTPSRKDFPGRVRELAASDRTSLYREITSRIIAELEAGRARHGGRGRRARAPGGR